MAKFLTFFKSLIFASPKENFYYLEEEMQFEHKTENNKLSYLSSYKNVG